jgi:hypothetical protein
MSASVIKMRRPAALPRQIGCSACGATTDAACDCGVPYVPAGERAAAAIVAHPEKSDRAIAAEIGVDHKTVGAARRAGGERSPPEKRIGQDGKAYPAKASRAAREKACEARFDKENLKTANAMVETFIAAGKMSDQQIADFRERAIIPPFRLFTACGMAFDGGPDAETSCNPTSVDDIEPAPEEPVSGLTKNSEIERWLVEMHSKYPDTFNVGAWEGSCDYHSIDKLRARHGIPTEGATPQATAVTP